jgi:hypothetical protein
LARRLGRGVPGRISAQISTLPQLKPREFHDLVVEVTLIRPGPIQGGSVQPYIRRGNGLEEPTYGHPLTVGHWLNGSYAHFGRIGYPLRMIFAAPSGHGQSENAWAGPVTLCSFLAPFGLWTGCCIVACQDRDLYRLYYIRGSS